MKEVSLALPNNRLRLVLTMTLLFAILTNGINVFWFQDSKLTFSALAKFC